MTSEQQRTRVKICGITRIEDGLCAVDNGVDALGFVFYEPSPRNIDIDKAAEMVNALPAFITRVALFVNADPAHIERVLNAVDIDLLQFHGEESEATCLQYKMPYIKAIRVNEETDLLQAEREFSSAKGLLLDAYVKGIQGGTGQAFNWSLIPENLDKPIILAGGLKPDNVHQAITQVRPYAVDVSGGVEQDKGIKDPIKISAFMQEVIHARQYRTDK